MNEIKKQVNPRHTVISKHNDMLLDKPKTYIVINLFGIMAVIIIFFRNTLK